MKVRCCDMRTQGSEMEHASCERCRPLHTRRPPTSKGKRDLSSRRATMASLGRATGKSSSAATGASKGERPQAAAE